MGDEDVREAEGIVEVTACEPWSRTCDCRDVVAAANPDADAEEDEEEPDALLRVPPDDWVLLIPTAVTDVVGGIAWATAETNGMTWDGCERYKSRVNVSKYGKSAGARDGSRVTCLPE
jgi:hypothetical protein